MLLVLPLLHFAGSLLVLLVVLVVVVGGCWRVVGGATMICFLCLV